MKIYFDFKPFMFQGPTKQVLINGICSYYGAVWYEDDYGYGFIQHNTSTPLGVNFEKRRRKMRVMDNSTGGKIRVKVQESHWVAYVYLLPANVKRFQHHRNFEIKRAA